MPKNEQLFAASLEAAASDNYLGRAEVVEALLRGAVGNVLSDRSLAKQECRRVGRILLGRDKNFAAMPDWNRPGGIDEFCAHWIGAAETDPEERMESAVLSMMIEFAELDEYAKTPGVLDEQWKWQIDAILQRYVGIFLGISPPAQAAMW